MEATSRDMVAGAIVAVVVAVVEKVVGVVTVDMVVS